MLRLDSRADFLDAEVYHLLTFGKYEEEEYRPILFSTMDPIDSILVRVGLFKSFVRNAFEAAQKADLFRGTYLNQGRVLVFNMEMEITYDFAVSEVDSLLDVLGEMRVEDWLQGLKQKFYFRNS